jgi:hypothetical protein
VLHALQNPRVNIAGIRHADLLPLLDQLSSARLPVCPSARLPVCPSARLPVCPSARLSRQLRRLRDIGVIKRVSGTYRYYLTRIGRAATPALCRVTQSVIIPAMI